MAAAVLAVVVLAALVAEAEMTLVEVSAPTVVRGGAVALAAVGVTAVAVEVTATRGVEDWVGDKDKGKDGVPTGDEGGLSSVKEDWLLRMSAYITSFTALVHNLFCCDRCRRLFNTRFLRAFLLGKNTALSFTFLPLLNFSINRSTRCFTLNLHVQKANKSR